MLAWAVHVDVPVLVLNGERDGRNRHDEPAFAPCRARRRRRSPPPATSAAWSDPRPPGTRSRVPAVRGALSRVTGRTGTRERNTRNTAADLLAKHRTRGWLRLGGFCLANVAETFRRTLLEAAGIAGAGDWLLRIVGRFQLDGGVLDGEPIAQPHLRG